MGSPLRALIVEDSEDDTLLIVGELRRAGYDPRYERVETREQMDEALDTDEWEIVIADYHLPKFNAPAALAALQTRGRDLPFIIVSGAIGEETAVEAMKVGANDYVMKDNLARLGPAVKRELREAEERHQRRQAERAVRRRNRELSALNAVAEALSDFLDIDRILKLAFERALEFSGLRSGAIWLVVKRDRPLHLAVYQGFPDEFRGYAQEQAQAIFDIGPRDGNIAPRPALEPLRVVGVDRQPIWQAGLPLLSHGSSAGMLLIGDQEDIEVSQSEIALLTRMAGLIGTAVQNAGLFHQVRKGRDQLDALSRRLVETQEAERQHLARELHDEIGQLLTGLKLSLQRAQERDEPARQARLGEALQLIGDLVSKVRTMSLELRPAMLDDLGLIPALLWHFGRYQEQTSVEVDFKHSGLDHRFDSQIETAAYRIVQEALTNVARHAGVGSAQVTVTSDGEQLMVEVRDRGSGFDPERAVTAPLASGLAGMHQRANLLGGTLTIESSSQIGTRLVGVLPLEGRLERRVTSR